MEEKLTMRIGWGRQCACVSHEANMCKAAHHMWSVRLTWGGHEAHCNTHGTHEAKGSGLWGDLSIWWFRVIGAKCESCSRKSGKIGKNLGKLIWVCNIPAPSLFSDSISSSDIDTDCCGTEDEETNSGWELDRSDYPPRTVTQLPLLPPSGGRNPSTFALPGTLIPMKHACSPTPAWALSCLQTDTLTAPSATMQQVTIILLVSSHPRSTMVTITPFHLMEGSQRTTSTPPSIMPSAYTRILRRPNASSVTRMGQYKVICYITSYPPSVYFGRTTAYKLHMYCADMDYHACIKDLHCFHADMYNLLHTLHAILTLEQSTECMKSDMLLLAFDGVISVPVFVHQGEFFQQCMPSANPFLTLEETGFTQSTCRLLWFYGEHKLADIINQVLELTLPDGDLITQFLHQFLLDDPTSFEGSCACSTCHQCEEAKQLHSKQEHFYWHYGNTDTAPPPAVPPILLTLLHTFTN